MRKALIGILMAATAATPLAAQDNGWRGRGHDAGEQRSQRAEQRVAQPRQQAAPQGQRFQGGWAGRGSYQPQAAPQAPRFQGGWAGRSGFQQQAPAQVQPQQRGAWQGRGNAGWGGQNRFQGQGGVAYQRNYAPQQDRRSWSQQRNYALQQDGRYQGNRDTWRGGDRRWEGNRDRDRWNRDWRSDRRYDWQRYRYANRAIFHLGPYYAPFRDYYYSPLEIGIALDAPFFAQDYWIDPAFYDLPPPPPGAEWVRYYNDVVLVDTYSGEVLDVIHNFFW